MRRTLSTHPKVLLTRTPEGNYRGSCDGCGTVAVIVGRESAMAWRARHARCPDETVRIA